MSATDTKRDLAEWCRAMPADAANEIERLRKMVRHASDQGVTFPPDTLPKVRAAVVVVEPDGSERLAYDPDADASPKH